MKMQILICFLFFSWTMNSQAQTGPFKPKDAALYKTIATQDSVLFVAFNAHDMDVLKKVFATDVEFYNDGGGLTDYKTTMDNFEAMFDRNKSSGLRRELVKGSLEVYPMPGFGAIEMASHRFIHTENGKEEVGTQKFVAVWRLKDNEWKITRMISLGH